MGTAAAAEAAGRRVAAGLDVLGALRVVGAWVEALPAAVAAVRARAAVQMAVREASQGVGALWVAVAVVREGREGWADWGAARATAGG